MTSPSQMKEDACIDYPKKLPSLPLSCLLLRDPSIPIYVALAIPLSLRPPILSRSCLVSLSNALTFPTS